jgi:hypothetical protein
MIFLSGLSQPQADGRYVRRFVGASLAADSYSQQVATGAFEPTLGNPSGPLQGGIPLDAAPTLLDAGDGARFGTRIRVVRIGNPGTIALARANGSFQAPTQVLINETAGSLACNARNDAGGYTFLGQASFLARENVTATAGGSSFIVSVPDIGTVSAKAVATFRGGGASIAEWLPNQTTFRIFAGSTQGDLRGSAGSLRLMWNETGLGFFGTAAIAKPAATGSRGGNAALASLLTQLAALGLITDSTTA